MKPINTPIDANNLKVGNWICDEGLYTLNDKGKLTQSINYANIIKKGKPYKVENQLKQEISLKSYNFLGDVIIGENDVFTDTTKLFLLNKDEVKRIKKLIILNNLKDNDN